MAVTKAISKDYLVTQLKNFDKEILEGKYIQITNDASYSIKKLGTATEGALATYKLTKTVGDQTVELGDAIDIPKDFLVKSASVKTVITENDPVEGYKAGDKYIDFIINTKDSEQGSSGTCNGTGAFGEACGVCGETDGGYRLFGRNDPGSPKGKMCG